MKPLTDTYGLIITLLFSTILLATAGTSRNRVTLHRTVSPERLEQVYEYHESDSLVTDSPQQVIYLNQTRTETDTVYIYTVKKL